MNSFLNTLKKTEAEKKRRAAQLHQANADEAAALEPEPPTELTLQLEPDNAVAEQCEVASGLAPIFATDVGNLATTETAKLSSDQTASNLALSDEPKPSAGAAPAEQAQLNNMQSMVNTAALGASDPVSSQMRQRAIHVAKPRSLLPWIAIGGGVLLAGVVAWITWQYQHISQGALTPLPRALPPDVASAPAVVEPQAMLTTPLPSYGSESASYQGYDSKPNILQELPSNTPDRSSSFQEQKNIGKQSVSTPTAALSDAEQLKFEKTPSEINAPTMLAWEAYQQRNWRLAEQLYRKILASEPRHRDALLGLAAVHIQQQQPEKAGAIYQYLRQINPQDHEAEQALLVLHPERISPENAAAWQQSQSQADSRSANPVLLGQYYASRSNWQQAQEQFFQAWSAQPNNADIAFNLAVSLDHLQQAKLAAEFYQQALTLAGQYGAAFDRQAAEARLAQLRLAGF